MIFAEPWPSLWFVLITPPQGELRASAWLARFGVEESWHPTEIVYVHDRKPPHKLIPKIKPICTGYLFSRFDHRPIWPFLFDQSRGKIQDVLRIGDRPVALDDRDLMAMQQMPARLQSMRDAAKEAATIRAGDTVTVTSGAMAGWTVTVQETHGGIARISLPLLGKDVELPIDRLTK